MRNFTVGLAFSIAGLSPASGAAQVLVSPSPYPQATAIRADWYLRGEPIVFAGALYYPSAAALLFDGNVMQRAGIYEGVPLYADPTLEPFGVVFVPVGLNIVRPYERLRTGEPGETVGTRSPSIQRDADLSAGLVGAAIPGVGAPSPTTVPPFPVPLGEGSAAPGEAQPASGAPSAGNRPIVIGSMPPPGAIDGVWVEHDGARWYSSGPAVPHTAERFSQVGEYRGFRVYRERGGRADEIYISSAPGGPVAPYSKR